MTDITAETRASAALAELIYARDPRDQGMTVADIRKLSGLQKLADDAISVWRHPGRNIEVCAQKRQ
jgi:hypothetical protein